jgi:hypothetical protein
VAIARYVPGYGRDVRSLLVYLLMVRETYVRLCSPTRQRPMSAASSRDQRRGLSRSSLDSRKTSYRLVHAVAIALEKVRNDLMLISPQFHSLGISDRFAESVIAPCQAAVSKATDNDVISLSSSIESGICGLCMRHATRDTKSRGQLWLENESYAIEVKVKRM